MSRYRRRWFVQVMFEGQWRLAYVSGTYSPAEEAADVLHDETGGRDIRIISTDSQRKMGPVKWLRQGECA